MKNPNTQDDEILVRQAAAGSTDAFAELTARHYGAVFAIGCARLGDPDLAEDLAQEVFLRAYLHLAALQRGALFAAWTARIARNLATDWGSRRNRERSRLVPGVLGEGDPMMEVPDESAPDVRDELDRERLRAALRRALGELPAEDREIVLMHFARDFSHQAIARELGLPRSSVSHRLARSLERFRRALGGVSGPQVAGVLAPSSKAVARTVALVAAAAVLPVPARAALAAQSAELVARSAVTGSPWFPLLPAPKAAAFATGAIMAKKTVVILTVAAAVLWGGHHVLQGRITTSVSPAANSGAPPASATGDVVLRVNPSTRAIGDTALDPDKGTFRATGTRPHELMGMLYDTTPGRLVVGPGVPAEPVDAEVLSTRLRGDAFVAALRSEVARQLGIRAVRERRQTDVLILSAPGGTAPAGLRPSAGGARRTMGQPGSVAASGMPASLVARRLEFALRKPAFLEPDIPGIFDFNLTWNPSDPGTIVAATRQLGFQVTPGRREVEILTVEKVP